jgi:hypothetical protein
MTLKLTKHKVERASRSAGKVCLSSTQGRGLVHIGEIHRHQWSCYYWPLINIYQYLLENSHLVIIDRWSILISILVKIVTILLTADQYWSKSPIGENRYHVIIDRWSILINISYWWKSHHVITDHWLQDVDWSSRQLPPSRSSSSAAIGHRQSKVSSGTNTTITS